MNSQINNISRFKVSIDFKDVVSFQKLRGFNSNKEIKDIKIKKKYICDHFLQINVFVTDGSNFLQKENEFMIQKLDQPQKKLKSIKE